MTEFAAMVLPYAFGLISVLFTLLIGIIAFTFNGMHTTLTEFKKEVTASFSSIYKLLKVLEGDLREDLADLDRRQTRTETACNFHHRREDDV